MTTNKSFTNGTEADYHAFNIPIPLEICTATVITLFNLLVIFLYVSMKKGKKKIPNFLMFVQAVVDMYQAVVAWFETIADMLHTTDDFVNAIKTATYAVLFEYSLALCLLTLLVAAIERYLCITKPFFHKRFVTKCRVIYASISVWILSLIAPFCMMYVAEFDGVNLNSSAVVVYSYVFDVIFFLLIVVIITALVLSFKAGRDSMNVGISAQQQQHMSKKRGETLEQIIRKKVRLVVIFSVMLGAFLVSFLPFAIGRLLFDTGMLDTLPVSYQCQLLVICHMVYKGSSFFNPLLTLTLKDDYRKALMNLFVQKSQNARHKSIGKKALKI